jgi:hypothetical protein
MPVEVKEDSLSGVVIGEWIRYKGVCRVPETVRQCLAHGRIGSIIKAHVGDVQALAMQEVGDRHGSVVAAIDPGELSREIQPGQDGAAVPQMESAGDLGLRGVEQRDRFGSGGVKVTSVQGQTTSDQGEQVTEVAFVSPGLQDYVGACPDQRPAEELDLGLRGGVVGAL